MTTSTSPRPAIQPRRRSSTRPCRPHRPTVETEEGRRFTRQPIHFTADKTRQTAFLDIRLAAPTSVVGRALEVDIRCPAGPLNEEFPFLLRLCTQSPAGAESWGDLRPSAVPDGSWQTLRFDPANPLRAARYEPSAVVGISVRLEDAPGQAREMALDVGEARVAWPPPWPSCGSSCWTRS